MNENAKCVQSTKINKKNLTINNFVYKIIKQNEEEIHKSIFFTNFYMIIMMKM